MRDPITYAVTVSDEAGLPIGAMRLVRASSRAQAIRFVASDTINARPATVDDGLEAGRLGVDVEDATANPASQDGDDKETE